MKEEDHYKDILIFKVSKKHLDKYLATLPEEKVTLLFQERLAEAIHSYWVEKNTVPVKLTPDLRIV